MKKLILLLVIFTYFSPALAATSPNLLPFTTQLSCNENSPLLTDYMNETLRLIYTDSTRIYNVEEKSLNIPMTLQELNISLMGLTLTVPGSEIVFPKRMENGLNFTPSIVGLDKNQTLLKVEFESVRKVPGRFFGEEPVDSGFAKLTFYKNSGVEKTLREVTLERTTIDPITKSAVHVVKDCYIR